MSKYDPHCFDNIDPEQAKRILSNFEWKYVALADEAQNDEFYKISRAALDQQKSTLEKISARK